MHADETENLSAARDPKPIRDARIGALRSFKNRIIHQIGVLPPDETNDAYREALVDVVHWLSDELRDMEDDMPDTDEQGRTYTEQLEQALEQACRDLHQAHNELMKVQGAPHEEALKMQWPEWSPQAYTIRWAEKILDADLRKRDFMLTDSEDFGCIHHSEPEK